MTSSQLTPLRNGHGSRDERPTQAVILAGGRGSRLRPFTDTRPKPMFEINGAPFLEYLIEQVRDQGFERVLLLLGWLPDVIQDHFGTGRRWGVRIEYSVSDVGDDTGRRLKLAEPRLDRHFLLLYGDNYWPMRFGEMWERFRTTDTSAMITIYRNRDGYTRDGVLVDADDRVVVYDKSRLQPNLRGVEIGYAIVDRSVVAALPTENVCFEAAAYPSLATRRQLLAYQTDHRYYSIGSLDRVPLTERFLAREPTIIVDRDGVLNRKPPRAAYVRRWGDWEWLPGAREALRLLRQIGYRVVVVSNQAGIGRRLMTETDLHHIHARMQVEALAAGGRLDAVYYCPHGWNDGCECRKPRPGMLFQAQRDLSLDLTRTVFVGDDDRDREAANAAGCPFALVTDEQSFLQITRTVTSRANQGVDRAEARTGHRA